MSTTNDSDECNRGTAARVDVATITPPTPTTIPTTPAADAIPTTTSQRASQAQYSVPVKSEFISSERPLSLPSTQRLLNATTMNCTTTVPSSTDDPRDSNNNNNNNGNDHSESKRNRRKQNKKRPRDVKLSEEHKICRAILRGETCPYVTTNGDTQTTTCRYLHDVAAFLPTRPPDIQPVIPPNLVDSITSTSSTTAATTTTAAAAAAALTTCPIYQLHQYCPYGIMCRFGMSHIDPQTGRNHPPSDIPTRPVSSNLLSPALQTSLRKNTYPFTCQRRKHEARNAAAATTTASTTPIVPKEPTKEPVKGGTSSPTTTTDGNDTMGATVDPVSSTISPPPVETTTTTSSTTIQHSYGAYPSRTRKLVDFAHKVYVAPLTTVGNLPFRRIMKEYGADITCGEMALCSNLLEGKAGEWALIKRHSSETIFGIQLAAGYPDLFTRTMELVENEAIEADFIDLNLGCPIDLVCQKGGGAALMQREKRLQASLQGILSTLTKCPITIKMRTGWDEKSPTAHDLVHKIQNVWGYHPANGVNAIMIHGRSRLQRYSRDANWDYIGQIAKKSSSSSSSSTDDPAPPTIPIIGNGDILTFQDYQEKVLSTPGVVPCAMLGRGALIKPWLPREIKEMKHYDISASERLDILRNFVRYGLEHWGTDQQGVNNCRRFLLEWLSFLHRYVPVGLLEYLPQRLNQRPPPNVYGRNDLETLFMSNNCYDWIKISEMLLGPVPDNFHFEPKHKANSYTWDNDQGTEHSYLQLL